MPAMPSDGIENARHCNYCGISLTSAFPPVTEAHTLQHALVLGGVGLTSGVGIQVTIFRWEAADNPGAHLEASGKYARESPVPNSISTKDEVT